MTSLLEKAAEEEKKSAPRHNLFRLLDLTLDEQNTHSRLLANLLSPRGTHGQQHLFLAEFLRHCQGPHGMPVPSQESGFDDWRVEREKAIQNGRIDIVLSSSKESCLLAMENKILAGEQENQLARYQAWLDSQSEGYRSRVLVFLTLDGRPPKSCGSSQPLCLSYRTDIADVLRKSLPHVTASRVVATLQTYLETIQELTIEMTEAEDEN